MGLAYVTQDYETTWHTNPVSGHSWPERRDLNKWIVRGGSSTGRSFRSEKGAEEHANFLNKWCYMLDATNMTRDDRTFIIEASEAGLPPGFTPCAMTVLNCPEKGMHRSFNYVGTDECADGEIQAWNFEEHQGPNRGFDAVKGLAPLRIVIIND